MPGEAGWYLGVTGWLPSSAMVSEKGELSTFTAASHLPLTGRAQGAFGAELGIAVGLHNSLKISYFQAHKSGTQIAPVDMAVYSQGYKAGDELSTNARFREYKISYEFLTWPYPVEARKFRFKTLYQVHYLSVHNVVDAPIKSATPDPTTGALIPYSAQTTQSFFVPAFGVGIHEYATRNFRFEANLSGFAWPGHWYLGDGDASIAYRTGRIELRAGAKALLFRTSPKLDYYFRGSMGGAFVGLRWYSN